MTVLFVLKVWAISQHTEKDYTFRNEKLSIRIFFIQHHHQLILQTFDFSNFATSRSSWKESPSCAYSLWSFWSLPLRFWRRLWRKWRRPGTNSVTSGFLCRIDSARSSVLRPGGRAWHLRCHKIRHQKRYFTYFFVLLYIIIKTWLMLFF